MHASGKTAVVSQQERTAVSQHRAARSQPLPVCPAGNPRRALAVPEELPAAGTQSARGGRAQRSASATLRCHLAAAEGTAPRRAVSAARGGPAAAAARRGPWGSLPAPHRGPLLLDLPRDVTRAPRLEYTEGKDNTGGPRIPLRSSVSRGCAQPNPLVSHHRGHPISHTEVRPQRRLQLINQSRAAVSGRCRGRERIPHRAASLRLLLAVAGLRREEAVERGES